MKRQSQEITQESCLYLFATRHLCYIFCRLKMVLAKNDRRKIRMMKISVRAANGKYEVLCGRGVLRELPRVISRVGQDGAVFVISSPRVWRHWGARIEKHLGGTRRATILMDDAETAKNLSTVERACRDLVRAGADRRALLVAVGGGVVGDVAGFVAASYARGAARRRGARSW